MMVSYDWRVRHAGLMAIAAIGEGTGKVRDRFTFGSEVSGKCFRHFRHIPFVLD